MNQRDIIRRPIISEKSLRLVGMSKYMFEVSKDAKKGHIKKVVEDLFNVNVLSVSTLRNAPKQKRSLVKNKTSYVRSGVKKAIVEIKKDQKIDLFDVKEGKKK